MNLNVRMYAWHRFKDNIGENFYCIAKDSFKGKEFENSFVGTMLSIKSDFQLL